MLVRPLTPTDADALHSLRQEALRVSPEAFLATAEEEHERDAAWFASKLGAPGDDFTLGAFLEGELVGMAGFVREQRRKVRHKGFVWGMYVRPDARVRGAGKALLDELIARARRIQGLKLINLCVVTTCAGAVRLYERVGFTMYGVERNALEVGEQAWDELHMVMSLADARASASPGPTPAR